MFRGCPTRCQILNSNKLKAFCITFKNKPFCLRRENGGMPIFLQYNIFQITEYIFKKMKKRCRCTIGDFSFWCRLPDSGRRSTDYKSTKATGLDVPFHSKSGRFRKKGRRVGISAENGVSALCQQINRKQMEFTICLRLPQKIK